MVTFQQFEQISKRVCGYNEDTHTYDPEKASSAKVFLDVDSQIREWRLKKAEEDRERKEAGIKGISRFYVKGMQQDAVLFRCLRDFIYGDGEKDREALKEAYQRYADAVGKKK